jgi:hypothetical protein
MGGTTQIAATPMRRLTPNSRYILSSRPKERSRWFGDIFFVPQQFALSLFSLSLVGMERVNDKHMNRSR